MKKSAYPHLRRQVRQKLPGRKLARFYQIENKMDAVIRYYLAATIPVIEEERD